MVHARYRSPRVAVGTTFALTVRSRSGSGSPTTAPSSYMGPGVGGWMAAGLIYLGYLYRKHSRRITEVGLVHLDEPTAEEVPV
jgi:hypothetical protein